MAKVEIYCLVRKRHITTDARIANALVKMKRARFVDDAFSQKMENQTYKTRMMVSENPDKKDYYKKVLTSKGVEFDGRWKEEKLKELVDSLEEKTE